MRDPYSWPQGDCLENRLGIYDQTELDQIEFEVALIRDAEVRALIVPGLYDLKHLQRFHRRLFSDIYDWAGKLRTVGISKGLPFAHPGNIESSARDILSPLQGELFLSGLTREAFLDKLAYYLGHVNALHPFREGNGRTQRAFFRQMAATAGWVLDWSAIDKEANDSASYASLCGNDGPLRNLLDQAVTKMTLIT